MSWRVFNNSTFNFDWKYRSQFFQNESQLQLRMQKQTFIGFGVEEGYERVFEEEFGPTRAAVTEAVAAGRLSYFFGFEGPSLADC